jgi:hypothetical protein
MVPSLVMAKRHNMSALQEARVLDGVFITAQSLGALMA